MVTKLIGWILGGAIVIATTVAAQVPPSQREGGAAAQAGDDGAASQKLTFEGEVALWSVAIKPDRTADFEQVLAKLKQALAKSPDPQRQRQAAGWTVVRLSTPLPDGDIPYVHIVQPVVAGVDYSVMQILYDAFPEERQQLYELYRGAFARNVSLATGNLVIDMGPAETGAHPPSVGESAPAPAPLPAPSPSAPEK